MTVPEYRQISNTSSPSNASAAQVRPGSIPPGSPLPLVWTPLQRIYLLNDFLSSHLNEYGDPIFWQRWVAEFFAPEATLSISLPKDQEDSLASSLVSNTPASSTASVSSTDASPRKVCIPRALIPRFFWIWAQSGMCRASLRVERIKEMMLPNGHLLLDSYRCHLLSYLDNSLQVVEHSGPARFIFGAHSKIILLDLNLVTFEHYISSKSQCLFTLPLKSGFDQAVHQFFDLQAMVQASASRLPGHFAGVAPGFKPSSVQPPYTANGPYPSMKQPMANPPYKTTFVPQGFAGTRKPVGYPPILPNGIPGSLTSPGTRLRGSNRGRKPRVQRTGGGGEDETAPPPPPALKFEEYQPPIAKEPKGPEATSCS